MDFNTSTDPDNVSSITLLCVDDEKAILTSLRRTLRGLGTILTAESADQALEIIQEQPVDVVITDMRMPGKTGADLLKEIVERGLDPIRILLTGYSDLELLASAINDGRVNRYLRKPWDTAELLSTLKQELHRKRLEEENKRLDAKIQSQNEELKILNSELTELNEGLERKVDERTRALKEANQQLEESNRVLDDARRSTTRIFYNLISLEDKARGQAALLTGKLSALIAREMNLSRAEIGQARLAGILHELGLLTMSDEISGVPLYQQTGEQREAYQVHALRAAQAMLPASHMSLAANAIKHQYEHWDGSGTPSGLAERKIPIIARILAVARDYIKSMEGLLQKGKRSSVSAFNELEKAAGYLYDPDAMEALHKAIPLIRQEFEHKDERVLSTAQVTPGMVLSRDLFNRRGILLLPKETRLTRTSIERLKQIETSDESYLEIYIQK